MIAIGSALLVKVLVCALTVVPVDDQAATAGFGSRGRSEVPLWYVFPTPEQLMADFEADIARWNHEHGRS